MMTFPCPGTEFDCDLGQAPPPESGLPFLPFETMFLLVSAGFLVAVFVWVVFIVWHLVRRER